MSTDTSKLRSKLTKLGKSLDELESQLEPLFSKSLPETLLALDTIQQAKLQVIIPYVVYDLVFVYLKSRGIDPKTHRVVAELERIREYFDKIKRAEEANQKRTLGVDKAAAERFIKHAIAQAISAQSADAPSNVAPEPSSSSNNERVPIKVTSKMVARAEYQKQLKQLGNEEEDDLEVFDEEEVEENEDAMVINSPLEGAGLDKGKGRALGEDVPPSKRKRQRVDTLSDHSKKPKHSVPVQPTSTDDSLSRMSISTVETRDGKAAKKTKHKRKKP